MDRHDATRIVSAFPIDDAAKAFSIGLDLIRNDYPELLLPHAREAARRHSRDPRIHQLVGIAARNAGESRLAYKAFQKAAQYAPADPLIAHSLARTAMEAGRPAVSLFETAIRLAPQNGEVLQGHAAALIAEGRAQDAMEGLSAILGNNPGWLEGHRALAHLRGQLGLPATEALDRSLITHPEAEALHRLRVSLLLETPDPVAALDALKQARQTIGDRSWISLLEAHAASEAGQKNEANALFAHLPTPTTPSDASLHVAGCSATSAETPPAPLQSRCYTWTQIEYCYPISHWRGD